MLKREKELIICPTKIGWQSRYYDTLIQEQKNIPTVCENYVAMLEWNIRYYTTGCLNWTLYYKYSYPPLLQDLAKYIPEQQIIPVDKTVVTPNELLAYVLPNAQLHYLPIPHELKPEPTLEWSFCTYMWESHVK